MFVLPLALGALTLWGGAFLLRETKSNIKTIAIVTALGLGVYYAVKRG